MFTPKSPQARPLETPLEFGDPNCPSSRKLQTTFPRAGNLRQPILSILDRRFRHMFPRHSPVFRELMPCKCDRGVLKRSFFEVLKSQATIFGHNLC